MGKEYLIDTNVVIDYLDNKLPANAMQFMHKVVDNNPKLSVITKIELLRFNSPERVYKTLTDFIGESTVLELNDMVVNTTITICRANRIKLPDAIIAATAFEHKLELLTRNILDFNKISGLKLVNPHDL